MGFVGGQWSGLARSVPGLEFDDVSPDGFAPKERVADYFEAYARKFKAPIRTGVDVLKVERNIGRPGFTIETSEGVIEASRVVAATGPFQRPVIPPIAPKDAPFTQIHSAEYRNPQQMPEGAVLVVGAGSSGVQIADELQRSGKRFISRSGPMTALLAPIATVISAGGWACSVSGIKRR